MVLALVFRIDRLTLIALGGGLWILWKAITNDLWITSFTGDPVIPRWMYFLAGIGLVSFAV